MLLFLNFYIITAISFFLSKHEIIVTTAIAENNMGLWMTVDIENCDMMTQSIATCNLCDEKFVYINCNGIPSCIWVCSLFVYWCTQHLQDIFAFCFVCHRGQDQVRLMMMILLRMVVCVIAHWSIEYLIWLH